MLSFISENEWDLISVQSSFSVDTGNDLYNAFYTAYDIVEFTTTAVYPRYVMNIKTYDSSTGQEVRDLSNSTYSIVHVGRILCNVNLSIVIESGKSRFSEAYCVGDGELFIPSISCYIDPQACYFGYDSGSYSIHKKM